MSLNVVEIFDSIEGEGIRTGAPVTFIRLANCNLRCSYCDTDYAQCPCDGREMTLEQIAKQVNYHNVTITGGEPLLQSQEVISLMGRLKGYQINIETNGSVNLMPFMPIRHRTGAIFTMDYKLEGSGMEEAMDKGNLSLLNERDVLKFVVSNISEFATIKRLLMTIPIRATVFISPRWGKVDNQEMVKETMELQKLMPTKDIRFQLQLHKIIWDPKERGV